MSELMPDKEQSNETPAELAFQVFCAAVFLGMIGMVFGNAMKPVSTPPATNAA